MLVVRANRYLFDFSNKSKSTLVQCLEKDLIIAVVAKRAAGSIDPAAQRGFGNGPTFPDRLNEIILADDPVPIAHQVNNDVENLRLDVNRGAVPAQLLADRINLDIGKSI